MSDETPVQARRRLGVGAAIALVVVAFAVTVGIGILRSSTAPTTVVTPAAPMDAGPAGAPGGGEVGGGAYVDVAGAVAAPGLYLLTPGARVADAIAAAGGFLPEAERAAVNLARPVADGEQIVVPVVGAEPAAPAEGATDGLVNLNAADASALDTLPGIGPALAERIISWREENGRFTSVDDLLSVSGIGEKLLSGLRDLVRV